MRDKKVLYITQAAVIAALYVVLTVLFAPISFKEVQVRISRLTLCAEVWRHWQARAEPGRSERQPGRRLRTGAG